jgi:hypothetical protein
LRLGDGELSQPINMRGWTQLSANLIKELTASTIIKTTIYKL